MSEGAHGAKSQGMTLPGVEIDCRKEASNGVSAMSVAMAASEPTLGWLALARLAVAVAALVPFRIRAMAFLFPCR
jgi:hypothetical protein